MKKLYMAPACMVVRTEYDTNLLGDSKQGPWADGKGNDMWEDDNQTDHVSTGFNLREVKQYSVWDEEEPEEE